MKEISKESMKQLQKRFIIDLSKPDISVLDRAIMIENFQKSENLSLRDLSKNFNIPKTNIVEWKMPLRLDDDKKKEIDKETKLADVYTMLGKDRLKRKSEDNTTLDEVLIECINKLKHYADSKIKSEIYVRDSIVELKNMLGELLKKV